MWQEFVSAAVQVLDGYLKTQPWKTCSAQELKMKNLQTFQLTSVELSPTDLFYSFYHQGRSHRTSKVSLFLNLDESLALLV